MNAQTSDKPVILAFAPGPWGWPDFAGSPRYHLWGLAERGWTVVYLEPPRRVRLAWQPAWSAPDRPFHAAAASGVPPFSPRAVPNRPIGEMWRRGTSRLWMRRAMQVCRELGLTPEIFWFGAPWHGVLSELAPPHRLQVAHVYDELSESPVLSPWRRRMLWQWECALLKRCEAVFCSSAPQFRKREGLAGKIVLLENAVRDDFAEVTADSPVPPSAAALVEQLRAVPRPRLVYGGVADLRLDAELIARVMQELPEAHLVFLGKKDPSLDPRLAKVTAEAGRTHFLGSVPYSAYPYLYREADVLLLAHRRLPFTEAMYPEKLNEYLASGRPIVSVALPEACRLAEEAANEKALRLACNADEYAAAVREALEERGTEHAERRRALARQHTWSLGAERLEWELMALLGKA